MSDPVEDNRKIILGLHTAEILIAGVVCSDPCDCSWSSLIADLQPSIDSDNDPCCNRKMVVNNPATGGV
jgi:hypothetical protein